MVDAIDHQGEERYYSQHNKIKKTHALPISCHSYLCGEAYSSFRDCFAVFDAPFEY